MANTFKVEIYNSTKVIAYVSIGIFAMIVLFNIVYVLWGVSNFLFPNWQIDNNGFMMLFSTLIEVIGSFEGLIRLVAIVFFLIWLYKSFNNLSPLKARHLEFSPGWAVGWWFIPFANLVKPYQVVGELWRESDPEFDEDLGFLSSHVGNPTHFGIWWGCWIVSNITANITVSLGEAISRSTGTDSATITAFFTIFIVSGILTIVAGGLLIYIIWDTTMRQEKRFERIGYSTINLPPQPPVFNE